MSEVLLMSKERKYIPEEHAQPTLQCMSNNMTGNLIAHCNQNSCVILYKKHRGELQ